MLLIVSSVVSEARGTRRRSAAQARCTQLPAHSGTSLHLISTGRQPVVQRRRYKPHTQTEEREDLLVLKICGAARKTLGTIHHTSNAPSASAGLLHAPHLCPSLRIPLPCPSISACVFSLLDCISFNDVRRLPTRSISTCPEEIHRISFLLPSGADSGD